MKKQISENANTSNIEIDVDVDVDGDVLEKHYEFQDSQLLKLEIKESKLLGSGEGLFCTETLNTGQLICQYYGSIISSENSMDSVFNYEDKMVQIDTEYCVVSRSIGSKANDIVKYEPQKYNTPLYKLLRDKKVFPTHSAKEHNARISTQAKQKAFLIATKPIEPGEEIYIDYGFQYWDFFLNQAQSSFSKDLL